MGLESPQIPENETFSQMVNRLRAEATVAIGTGFAIRVLPEQLVSLCEAALCIARSERAQPSVTAKEWQALVEAAREEGRIAGKIEALRERLDTPSASARTLHPGADELNQAYTPTIYDGQHENAPPPYINISEAKGPYEEAIITVRSPRKTDGSPGDSAFIVMTKSALRSLLLKVARRWGWLPMTEEQWLRDYYLDNPEEAKKARERIA